MGGNSDQHDDVEIDEPAGISRDYYQLYQVYQVHDTSWGYWSASLYQLVSCTWYSLKFCQYDDGGETVTNMMTGGKNWCFEIDVEILWIEKPVGDC